MFSEKLHRLEIVALVTIPLIGTIAAILLFWNQYVFWRDILMLAVGYVVIALGVAIGYHRLLTHQSFSTYPPIKAIILIFGCMAFEGGPLDWAATHLKHHAHSDQEGDPHSPLEGFWHAHVGWLFSLHNFAKPGRYTPHLMRDKVVRFVNDYAMLWMFLSLFIPFLIGGWTGLLWAGAVRVFLTTHITWSVNSVCHSFGQRTFKTTDQSHNNWLIGLLALGEGWHNNHHAFPTSAFHGLRWWQFDLAGLVIRFLEATGLAWNVKRVKPEIILLKASQ